MKRPAWFDPAVVQQARRALAQGQRDRDALILAHLPLAVAMARKAAWQMQALARLDDWIQEASLTLVEAATVYVRDRKPIDFQQYAANAIHRHLAEVRRQEAPVEVPQTTFRLVPAYQKLVEQAQADGQPLTDQLASQRLGIPVRRVAEVRQAWLAVHHEALPLDARLAGRDEEDAPTVADVVVDEGADVEAQALAAVEREERQELWRAVADLERQDRVALGLNMGAATFERATVAEIERAADSGVQHRARQHLAKLFREGRMDARRLGFLPSDATGRQAVGRRVVNLVSGRRGSARVRGARRGTHLGRGVAGSDDAPEVGARAGERPGAPCLAP